MPCSLKFDKETVVMDVQSVYRLVLLQGPTPGKVYELRTETASIGRDISNEVIIADTEVSRFHARLVWQNGDQPGQLQGYAIEDRGSTNGTFVNGLRLVGRRPLMPNEIINFGEKVSLRFEVLPASSSNAATEIAGGFLNPSATLVPNEPAAPISAYAPQQPYIPPVAPAMPEPLPQTRPTSCAATGCASHPSPVSTTRSATTRAPANTATIGLCARPSPTYLCRSGATGLSTTTGRPPNVSGARTKR
jgi:predicted component of type VI protein secretion system